MAAVQGSAEARRRRRWWSVATLVVLILTVCGYHAVWIHRHRSGWSIEVDEGSYLSEAVVAEHLATSRDLGQLRSYYLGGDRQNAPLLSVVTVPFLVVGTISLPWALATELAVLVLLLGATFLLARRLATDGWALLAVAAVAATPGIVDYTRAYHFALLSTATMTAAVACLVLSDRFTRPLAAVGWGVFLGLMVLSRTMMVSFLPAMLLAAVVAAVASGPPRRSRIAWFIGGLAVAGALALPWWVANWDPVTRYLTGFGYGGSGAAFGPLYAPFEPLYYLRVPYRIAQELYLPLAVPVLAGLSVLLVDAVGALRRLGARPFLSRAVEHGHLLVALTVLVEMASLSSSRNKGTGFVLPLVPLVICLAVAGASRIRLPAVRAVTAAALVMVLVADLAMKSGAVPGLAARRGMALSAAEGAIPITDGRSHLGAYLEPAPYPDGTDVSPLARRAVHWMVDHSATNAYPIVRVSDGDLLLFPSLFGLMGLVDEEPIGVQTLGQPPEDTVAGYERALTETGEGGFVEYLVTVDLEPFPASYSSAVDEATVVAAARRAGFDVVQRYPIGPDRTLRIWQRTD